LPTGLLSASAAGFEFRYVLAFTSDPDQRPLLGFSDYTRVYRSPTLFPFFKQRVLEADRSDRAAFLRWLGLPNDASDWEVLARGGGTRKGDRFELVAAPELTPTGGAAARVLARGLRFVGAEIGFDRLDAALAGLAPGMRLQVNLDAKNVVNRAARRVLDAEGTPLGWIPDVLLSHLAPTPSDPINVRVAQVNGADAPWHLRLLIDLDVHVRPPTPIFSTPEWRPVAERQADATVV
jgi:hypothetical protein